MNEQLYKWNTNESIPAANLTASLNDAMVSMMRPISVAIDATLTDFYFYTGGYFYDPACSSTELDHQVLAVGYTTWTDGNMYTLIKNSWSDHWGDGGYVWMSQKDNNCGVATSPNYITLAGEDCKCMDQPPIPPSEQ